MSLSPAIAEVERAKSQLKASLLLGLDGTTAIAEDVSHNFSTANINHECEHRVVVSSLLMSRSADR